MKKDIKNLITEDGSYIVVTRKGLAVNGNKVDLISLITSVLHSFYNKGVISDKELNDIVGFVPDVPAYLKGVPCNMINIEPKKTSQKIVNIAVDISVSAMIDKEEMKQAGILYLSVIDVLEKAGYRCNLYVLDSSTSCGKQFYCATRIKTDREPLNIKKMAFCLAHSGFFRRILFKWEETCDFSTLEIEPTQHGYGQPYNDINEIKKVLKKHIKSDFLLWKLQQDYSLNIGDIIKRLEKDGIKLQND